AVLGRRGPAGRPPRDPRRPDGPRGPGPFRPTGPRLSGKRLVPQRVLPGASANLLEPGPRVRRLLAALHQALMEVVHQLVLAHERGRIRELCADPAEDGGILVS